MIIEVPCELVLWICCISQNKNMEKCSILSSFFKLYGTAKEKNDGHDVSGCGMTSGPFLNRLNYIVLEYFLHKIRYRFYCFYLAI